MKNKKARHISNESLVERFQNGEKEALEQLIVSFQPKLKQAIYLTTRSPETVDDLSQECWYIIIRKLESLKLKISFEAWALTIARRKGIDWIRSQQRLRKKTKLIEDEAQNAVHSNNSDASDDKKERVRIGIQQLPQTQKIILTMFYLENLSLSEISNVLDIPKGTVKSRLFNARENLKSNINH